MRSTCPKSSRISWIVNIDSICRLCSEFCDKFGDSEMNIDEESCHAFVMEAGLSGFPSNVVLLKHYLL